MPEDRTPWAERLAKQHETIAQYLYDGVARAVKLYGPQPLDPETGQPQERMSEAVQQEIHALIRDNNEATLTTLFGEASRLGLSVGLLPKQMVKDMITAEGRHLRMGGE